MRRAETLGAIVMTRGAKLSLREPEKRRLRSGVGDVAGQAILRGGSMVERLAETGIVVTARAEVLLRILQQSRVIGAMGVMARSAGTEVRVNMGRIQVNRVTVQA
jgi:hypothetical protein